MTTVADLVAKLGFQVDTRGFDNFKKSLEAFQSIIRDGLKDLKEYAKQAEKISKVMKEAYSPSKIDAAARYRAVTREINARARSLSIRARELPEMNVTRRMNAEARLRQVALKEAGGGSGRSSGISGAAKTVSAINSVLSGGIGGFLTAITTMINPLLGAITALGSKIVSGIMTAATWLWGQLKEGLRYAMAFRDYRTFTGKNTTQLRNLIGMAGATTSMTQQDVLKDATQIGQSYWDMWFGGGNPAAWQLLGIMPTGNGARDLNTIIKRIRGVAGENRGLALNLLKQFGLSEQYMTIMYDRWEDYQRGAGEKNFVEFIDEELNTFSELNEKVRNFGFSLDRLRSEFVKWLNDTIGLDNILKTITDYLKGIIIALRGGESIKSIITGDPRRLAKMGASGKYFVDEEDLIKSEIATKMGLGKGSTFGEVFRKLNGDKSGLSWLIPGAGQGELIADLLEANRMHNAVNRVVTFNNNFDMSGRPMDDATQGYENIQASQMTRSLMTGGLSNDTVMVPTF